MKFTFDIQEIGVDYPENRRGLLYLRAVIEKDGMHRALESEAFDTKDAKHRLSMVRCNFYRALTQIIENEMHPDDAPKWKLTEDGKAVVPP